MSGIFRIFALSAYAWLLCVGVSLAGGPLDGRVFNGMIGPVEDPDLKDSLYFSDGHFWSDICTKCGFMPGEYEAEQTEEGIRFTGILESDSRGRFAYEGLVRADGSIEVSIQWERKRWYWTARREIAFRGMDRRSEEPETLAQIRAMMNDLDPDASPLCARF
ncbi:MAG: hypothetical protein LJE62_02530 [Silicimonas sp.]|jgi:hypothetical protein|nr:hypothetical protein [Silicimonas sp.]